MSDKPGLLGYCDCVEGEVAYDLKGQGRGPKYWTCRSCGMAYSKISKVPGKIGVGRLEKKEKDEISPVEEIQQRLSHPDPPKMIFFGHYKQDIQILLEERAMLGDRLAEAARENIRLKEQRHQLQDELEKARDLIEEAKADVEGLDADKVELENEIEELRDEVEDRDGTIEVLQDHNQTLEAEIERLKEYEWKYNDLG